jgi:hypothetical protein
MAMTCRSCGVEIADKAIVCYRCGTPTAVPAAPPRARPVRGWRGPVFLAAVVTIGAWFAVPETATSLVRAAIAVGAGAVVLVAVMLMRRRG